MFIYCIISIGILFEVCHFTIYDSNTIYGTLILELDTKIRFEYIECQFSEYKITFVNSTTPTHIVKRLFQTLVLKIINDLQINKDENVH